MVGVGAGAYIPHIGRRLIANFPAGRDSSLAVLLGVDEPLGLYLPVTE